MLLKVYDFSSRFCFKQEVKVLTKIKNANYQNLGFPTIISYMSNC